MSNDDEDVVPEKKPLISQAIIEDEEIHLHETCDDEEPS